MKVLILGDTDTDTNTSEAAAALARAGHETTSCRADDPGTVCCGLEGARRCPLDDGVDVALAPFPADQLAPPRPALGYVCAVRRDVPVVALGDHPGGDDHPAITMTVGDLDDIAAVVAGVAARPLERHTTAARQAVRDCLDRHELVDIDSNASVVRRAGQLRVHVSTSAPLPASTEHAAAVRALAAVRDLDRDAASVSVSIG